MFRLWVGSCEFRGDITYSETILYGEPNEKGERKGGLAEWYRKLRTVARFLLGNLKGFDPDDRNSSLRSPETLASLAGVDRYMLAKLDDFVTKARAAKTEKEWAAFMRAYRAEMKAPAASHTLDLLAALSQEANFSVGCYCENEAHCHRSTLRELLREHGAKMAD